MSEKNIVKFMKHILEYRRQEVRASTTTSYVHGDRFAAASSTKTALPFSKMLSLHRQSPTHLDAQARALAAREKAVYAMKMLARRCSSVAAENR